MTTICNEYGEQYPEDLSRNQKDNLLGELFPDSIIIVLTADEFTMVQDIFAGKEDPEYYRQELDQIIDEAVS